MAAEVGHLQLAHDYWAETAFTDLHDLHDNVGSGLHIAAMAGAWMAAVAGFGGMRDHTGFITFKPRLPPKLTRLVFRMRFAARVVEVDVHRLLGSPAAGSQDTEAIAVGEQRATYRLLEGEAFQTRHHDQPVDLRVGHPVSLDVPAKSRTAPVTQPAGRTPPTRSATGI